MTRKDYIAIGEAVAKVVGRNIAVQEQVLRKNVVGLGNPQLVSEIGTQLIQELQHVFREDNARFDRKRFCKFFCEKEEEARAEREASF